MMLRTTRRTTTIAAAIAAAALGAGGTALAQSSGADAPTTVTVTSAPTLSAGQKAPFDAPGVRAIRRGKAIPSGYQLIGYHVAVHRGTHLAGAALRFACPEGKLLRTFGIVGRAGFSADRKYWDHKVTWVTSTPGFRADDGSQLTDVAGDLYAVCK
jgi:hypothetical protein